MKEDHFNLNNIPVLTRRKFLWLSSAATAGIFAGCSTDPITGQTQLMLVSEESEVQLDRKNSPHQFSADYGIIQDKALNSYISQTGKTIAAGTHRPKMPYSFQAVNATYVNAYAFPGGSIAATRGILVNLDNEAELAALIGHELGHVNARHTAEQMSKGVLTSVVVGGIAAYAGTKSPTYGKIAEGIGMLGSGMLIASYSRDNEREADSLGMGYMVKAGYSPAGFIGLMDMLKKMSKSKPGTIEIMFSTHPMSDERYATAVKNAENIYGSSGKSTLYRERYMDNTARLRAVKPAIEEIQNGDSEMGKKNYGNAETHFKKALAIAPGDYAGLVMMSKCLLIQEKYSEALKYAETAKEVYPGEAQAHQISGFARMKKKDYESAYQEFDSYEKTLPGSTGIVFYKGFCREGMKQFKESAFEYNRYLQMEKSGDQATYAYKRLVEWGYIKPAK
ncbi:MAG: peptidase M48 Ste24p [Desulfobacteraceae bacterium]|nr:MAG: peptidase M48 Ste24p [Desulfobacteraceae bacterium]